MHTSLTSICKSSEVFSFFLNFTFIFISHLFLFLFSSPLRMFVAYSSFVCIVLFRTCLTSTLATPCWPYKFDSFGPCLVPEVLAPPTVMLWFKMTWHSAELRCITNTSCCVHECKRLSSAWRFWSLWPLKCAVHWAQEPTQFAIPGSRAELKSWSGPLGFIQEAEKNNWSYVLFTLTTDVLMSGWCRIALRLSWTFVSLRFLITFSLICWTNVRGKNKPNSQAGIMGIRPSWTPGWQVEYSRLKYGRNLQGEEEQAEIREQ